MMIRQACVAALILGLCQGAAFAVKPAPVSEKEGGLWLRYVVPLPKKAGISAKVTLPLESVRVRVHGPAGDVVQAAATRLRQVLQLKNGGGSGFEIVLGVCDRQGCLDGIPVPGAAELAALPNREQAYVIAALGESRLALLGLDPRGVSYAAGTLAQLLSPKISAGKVEVPLARIIDWPDLGERGIWWRKCPKGVVKRSGLWQGESGYDDGTLDWFAGLKLNHQEIRVNLLVEKGKPATAYLDPSEIKRCRLRGIRMIPLVSHLEQLGGSGIFTAYPETRGKGRIPSWAGNAIPYICFSQPATQKVFDEWFVSIARDIDCDDVMVWLSENAVCCTCEACKAMEQYQHEMHIVLHAWREARKIRPSLRLRVLLTQGTFAKNVELIRDFVPQDVGVTFYSGGHTYTVARKPMIYPELRKAVQGRWFGCCPTLSGTWHVASPFAAASYMKERMGELLDAGAENLTGFAPPSLRVNELSLSAAAEFAWNATGRTPREFILAWATRHRYPDPEQVARWWEQIEEPQRDLYISGLTMKGFWTSVDRLVIARKPCRPGQSFLGGFPKEGRLEADIACARRAVAIAESIPNPRFLHEARYTLATLEMARASRDLTVRLAGRETLSEADQTDVAALFRQIDQAMEQLDGELEAFNQCVSLYPGQKLEPKSEWFPFILSWRKEFGAQLAETARKLGIGPLPSARGGK